MSRVELVEKLSDAVVRHRDFLEIDGLANLQDHRSASIQTPALRAIRHLLESSTRSRKPRPAVVEAFQPYQLKARLTDLSENANEFDVRMGAKMVLEVLERGTARETVGASAR